MSINYALQTTSFYQNNKTVNISNKAALTKEKRTSLPVNNRPGFCGLPDKTTSYLCVKPQDAIKMTDEQTLNSLNGIVGKKVLKDAMEFKAESPVQKTGSSDWLKKAKIVEVNPRITKKLFNITKYAMSFPEDSVLILPFLTSGSGNSLYSPLDWNISREFYDPNLDKNLKKSAFVKENKINNNYTTAKDQIKLTNSILHALGKKVGYDIQLHCDRFSKDVFIHPEYFDWIKLNKNKTAQLFPKSLDFSELNKEEKELVKKYYSQEHKQQDSNINDEKLKTFYKTLAVLPGLKEADNKTMSLTKSFLSKNGDYNGNKLSENKISEMYSPKVSENAFQDMIFGPKSNQKVRVERQEKFYNYLSQNGVKSPPIGYESIPKMVEGAVKDFIVKEGSAKGGNLTKEELENLYSKETSNEERSNILFGQEPEETDQSDFANNRRKSIESRREKLMYHINGLGFEPLPVANAAPYKPMCFDEMQDNKIWPKFTIPGHKEVHLIDNLTGYKLFHSDDKNKYITDSKKDDSWNYFVGQQKKLQSLGFDFIRADMGYLELSEASSHPEKANLKNPQIWADIKETFQKQKPYFATFAECFLDNNPYFNVRGHIKSDKENMENKKFDSVLANLHYQKMNGDFSKRLKELNNYKASFKPALACITADTDRPELVNELNKDAKVNKLRMFTSLFLDQPAYYSMGFEVKDDNPSPNKLLNYTKNFITTHYIDAQKKEKGTTESIEYNWGTNEDLFKVNSKMRKLYSQVQPTVLDNWNKKWTKTSNDNDILCWSYTNPNAAKKDQAYVFIANTNLKAPHDNISVENPLFDKNKKDSQVALKEILSTSLTARKPIDKIMNQSEQNISINHLEEGEGKVYQLIKGKNSLLSNITSTSN